MPNGLAHTAVYGNGEDNTITHYYAGDQTRTRKKDKKMACKSKKPPKKK
jgi:hypothetical protein